MEYRYSKDDLSNTLQVLREGGVILYPTDTVWGLGCDATNEEAVQKIFKIKRRMESNSFLLLIDTPNRIGSYVEYVPDLAWDMIEMATKPLSIIYDDARNLAHSVVAPDGSVGIRVCKEPFLKQLIQQLRKPIVSTSANTSGDTTPAIFEEIKDEIKDKVDYIVKYRQEDKRKVVSSSIIKLSRDGCVAVIRK